MTETRRLRARIADEIQQRGRKHASGEPLYFDRANLEAAIDAALLSEPQAAQRPVFGTWPEHCEQRAFVEGAKWWLWRGGSCTMFPTEVDEAEEEAIERYGAPPVLPAPPEADKAWEPFSPTDTDPSTTNSGDVGGSRTDR